MNRKVLVIESAADVAGMLEDGLRERGFSFALARNAEEGLWKASTERPLVIVINARLPYASGWEVCEEIKRNRETRNIPVLVLAGRADAGEHARACLAGCDAFMSGPVEPGKCVEIVARLANDEEASSVG